MRIPLDLGSHSARTWALVPARSGADRSAATGSGFREVIADLNPVLRGWGNYFRTGNAARRFNQLDSYVWQRLRTLRVKRKGRELRAGSAGRWTREYFHELGLHRLRGTVAYPEAVNSRWLERSPVSRVREIRTHGLKGGLAQTSALRREGK